MSDDVKWMDEAIRLAQSNQYSFAKKPVVGCIVKKKGEVVGFGVTALNGEHAELVALKKAGERAKGSTMYVTMEPCTHPHRQPCCAQAIINYGVARVVYGTKDPNPSVNGKGIMMLKDSGVELVQVCEEKTRWLHRYFIHSQNRKEPRIVQKVAISKDGKITKTVGTSTAISGKKALHHLHQLRSRVDAVLVGSGTAMVDNPQLTSRGTTAVSQPVKIVLDRRLRVDPNLNLFKEGASIVYTFQQNGQEQKVKIEELEKRGVRVVQCEAKEFLSRVLADLFQKNIYSVLVEGGSKVHESFLKYPVEKELIVYRSDDEWGSGVNAFGTINVDDVIQKMKVNKQERLGGDELIWGVLSLTA